MVANKRAEGRPDGVARRELAGNSDSNIHFGVELSTPFLSNPATHAKEMSSRTRP
jgi:hypothetical protein